MKLGDAISTVATPIAGALGMDCVDQETGRLKPESKCNKRKQKTNDLGDAVWDFLWPTTNKKENK